jgi:tRNA(Ile)-lysidine synthase
MERARDDRYALMAGWCRDNGITSLLTAHHRDDQAETVLFRLAKGSGLDGLGGIRPVTAYDAGLTLLRPLLDAPKDALVALCDAENIPYVRDPTNASPAFARNRLRAAMDILSTEGLNTKRLAKTAARIGAARTALEHYAKQAYADSLIQKSPDAITLDAAIIKAHPMETRRRVLMMCMENLDPQRAYAPRMEVVERIVDALFTDDDFTRASVGRFLVARQRKQGRIVVSRA